MNQYDYNLKNDYKKQVEINVDLYDEMKLAEAKYWRARMKYENGCYLARQIEQGIILDRERMDAIKDTRKKQVE